MKMKRRPTDVYENQDLLRQEVKKQKENEYDRIEKLALYSQQKGMKVNSSCVMTRSLILINTALFC